MVVVLISDNWHIIVNVWALRFHRFEARFFVFSIHRNTWFSNPITDFLAIESLLDIVCTLIPPVKNGAERRSQFIKEVFDSDLFQCNKSILQILESITDGDWSLTAVKIIEALANSDISLSAQSVLFSASRSLSAVALNRLTRLPWWFAGCPWIPLHRSMWTRMGS